MDKSVLNAIIVHKTDYFFSYNIYKYKQNNFCCCCCCCSLSYTKAIHSFQFQFMHLKSMYTLMVIFNCYDITSTDNNGSCIQIVSLSCHHLGGI